MKHHFSTNPAESGERDRVILDLRRGEAMTDPSDPHQLTSHEDFDHFAKQRHPVPNYQTSELVAK